MRAIVLDALAAPEDPGLTARLGAELADHLRHVLRERTIAWARRAGGGAEPLAAHRVADVPALLAGHDGPVVLVAPDVPHLEDQHIAAALDDLAAGTLWSSAPAMDGRPFLIALARPLPRLLELAGQPFDVVAAAALELGGELGMLRPERRLTSLADARALLADPLTAPELRELLAALR